MLELVLLQSVDAIKTQSSLESEREKLRVERVQSRVSLIGSPNDSMMGQKRLSSPSSLECK